VKLALYLINGPLGAGKTTLLKYLLSTAQFADARVVENEYASQSVDTQQLALHSAEVKTIAGVCICCSTGRELTVALEELAEQSDAPVIIEATGVANSLVLVEKLAAAQLLEYYELRHAVFVLDAAEPSADPERKEVVVLNLMSAECQALQVCPLTRSATGVTLETGELQFMKGETQLKGRFARNPTNDQPLH
jgi:G3E family GTPase